MLVSLRYLVTHYQIGPLSRVNSVVMFVIFSVLSFTVYRINSPICPLDFYALAVALFFVSPLFVRFVELDSKSVIYSW